MSLDSESRVLIAKDDTGRHSMYTTWNYTDNFGIEECRKRITAHISKLKTYLIDPAEVGYPKFKDSNIPYYKATLMGSGFLHKKEKLLLAFNEIFNTNSDAMLLKQAGFEYNEKDIHFESLPSFLETFVTEPELKIVSEVDAKSDITSKKETTEKKTLKHAQDEPSTIEAKKNGKLFLGSISGQGQAC